MPPGRICGANTDRHAQGEMAIIALRIKDIVAPKTFDAEVAPAANVISKTALTELGGIGIGIG